MDFMDCMNCIDCMKLQEIILKQNKAISQYQQKIIEKDKLINELQSNTAEKKINAFLLHKKEIILLSENYNSGENNCICDRYTDVVNIYYNCATNIIMPICRQCHIRNLEDIDYNVLKIINNFSCKNIELILKYKPTVLLDIITVISNINISLIDQKYLKQIRKTIIFILINDDNETLKTLLDKILIVEHQYKMDPLRSCVCIIEFVCCCENPEIEIIESNKQICTICRREMCHGCHTSESLFG
jgi:hypothetical protein